jgi:hypothetical protein
MEQIDYCGGPHYFIILTPLNRVAGFLVPYSRKPFTQFSPPHSMGIKKNTHALRGIINKKSGEYFEIRILKTPPRHLPPQSTRTKKSTPFVGC